MRTGSAYYVLAAILAWGLLPAVVNRAEDVVRKKPKPPRHYTGRVHFHQVQTGLSIPDEEAIRDAKEKQEAADTTGGLPQDNGGYGPLVAPPPAAKREEKPDKRNWLSPLDLAGDEAPEAPEEEADDSGWGWLADGAGLIQDAEKAKQEQVDEEDDPTANLSPLSLSNQKAETAKDNVSAGSLAAASPLDPVRRDENLFRDVGPEAESRPVPVEEDESVWTAAGEKDRSAFSMDRDRDWFAQRDVWRTDATRPDRQRSNSDMPQTRGLLSDITAPLLQAPRASGPRTTPSSFPESPGVSAPAATTPTAWGGLGASSSPALSTAPGVGGRYGGALDTGVGRRPDDSVGGSTTFDPTRSFLDR